MPVLRLLLISLLALMPVSAQAASQPIDTTPRVALFSAFEPEWQALLAIVEQPVSHKEKMCIRDRHHAACRAVLSL